MAEEFTIDKGISGAKKPEGVILTGMVMQVEFDRPYKNTEHYISPGGYELNGKQFDFTTTYGYVAEGNVVKMEVTDPDLDSFPDPISKEDVTVANINGKFDEFFIYTGEYNDPEINPVCVKNLTFLFSDGASIEASSHLLGTINELYKEKEEDMELD